MSFYLINLIFPKAHSAIKEATITRIPDNNNMVVQLGV